MSTSTLEAKFIKLFTKHYPAIKLESEQAIIPKRRYRFDFIHRASKVAIEINGQTYSRVIHTKKGNFTKLGGHNSGIGLDRDYEKTNLAAMNGWLVFQLSSKMINQKWIEKIEQMIRLRSLV
jgi:very-short-patch-repair endonuclease